MTGPEVEQLQAVPSGRDWTRPEQVSEERWQELLATRDWVKWFQEGLVTEAAFRQFRLTQGIYAQRQPGFNMVRIRVPLGRLNSQQIRMVAKLARKDARSSVHLTTRQDIQIHYVATEDCPDLLTNLAEVDLTTREACGNVIRNVTACPRAGLCPKEIFDVTPYALALNHYFLRHPLTQDLPRKFKIAFAGCSEDCSLTAIHDLGLIAAPNPDPEQSTTAGFRIVVGGGLGSSPELAHPFDQFVPADELLPVCEAILRVFHEEGERRNRNRARLKFVIRRLGIETFKERVEAEAQQTRRQEFPAIDTTAQALSEGEQEAGGPQPTAESSSIPAATRPADLDFWYWKERCAIAQKQEGYHTVVATVRAGNLRSESLWILAAIAERLGNSSVRLTQDQNLLLPWIHESNLKRVHEMLVTLDLADPFYRTIADVTSCPGACTCRTAVTHSREAAAELSSALRRVAFDPGLWDSSLKISGCPNGCSHHCLGTIGLQGAAVTVDGRKAPAYLLRVAGRTSGGAAIGRPVARIPARRLREVTLRLIVLYRRHREEGETLQSYLSRVDAAWLAQQLDDLVELKLDPSEKASFFVDFGDNQPFELTTSEGECAA